LYLSTQKPGLAYVDKQMKKQGDSADNPVFEAFQVCREGLVRSIMKMCARQQDVDDILQETYLRAFSANKKSRINSPQDYLFVVSRNLVIKGLSRQSREIATEIDEALLGADDSAIDVELHYRKKFEVFNNALRSLPENHRRAILLRKYYGLSHGEIAKKMNVSVSSVEKYIASGIKRCKQTLVSQGYEPVKEPVKQVQDLAFETSDSDKNEVGGD